MVDLFNLLEADAAPWSRRLRVATGAYLQHLIETGKITGIELQAINSLRNTPSR